jgi:hypothetical protein
MSAEVSHGRGGAGNFKVDDTEYVDGEVVRTGVVGSHGDGAYSSGRGGKSLLAKYLLRSVLLLCLYTIHYELPNSSDKSLTQLHQALATSLT